ncbi:AtuA-related protein [Nocardia rhamnosiphila]|uniref:AtuA-like ferredoxin-fold domain-containing protein n=1 Tax=Nocardia rhamnosiphila TaxID=426716 RepID=A0ABV2WYT3_9NOCA
MKVTVADIAYARSGDKGGMANVGVAARRPEFYPALVRELTAERVQDFFSDRAVSTDRYELPNIESLNFLLHGILGRGGTSTLRLDPQGKALADAICFIEIELTDAEAAILGVGA